MSEKRKEFLEDLAKKPAVSNAQKLDEGNLFFAAKVEAEYQIRKEAEEKRKAGLEDRGNVFFAEGVESRYKAEQKRKIAEGR